MTTLADVRDRLRQDLSDTAALRWPDSQLDRHIEHALSELGLAMPRELSAELATTPGSRDLSLASLTGLVDVEAVEFPVDRFPPLYPGFSTWASTLSLHTPSPPDGTDARVYYTALHTLDGNGTTLTAQQVEVLLTGAGAYAALELASGSTGDLELDPAAAERYSAWARARLTAFRQLLHTYGRKNRIRQRRLYTPA